MQLEKHDNTRISYLYDDLYESLPAGDYFYGVKFTGDNYCMVDIAKKAAAAKKAKAAKQSEADQQPKPVEAKSGEQQQ